MANYMTYWKTYWDKEYGPKGAPKHCCECGYGSSQDDILDKVEKGDSLWIVGRSEDDKKWLLLACLHVAKKRNNKERQRLVANPSRSKFFSPAGQSDFRCHRRSWPVHRRHTCASCQIRP